MWYFHLITLPKDPEALNDNKSKVEKWGWNFVGWVASKYIKIALKRLCYVNLEKCWTRNIGKFTNAIYTDLTPIVGLHWAAFVAGGPNLPN